ncbi:hypothetical protein KFK09_001801 [Dendrobium nobile]|uniref:Uncharacterized protein n=1 Tax=Dendrobium nobile TaxID=94219 RepID=A0A8T3C985_DENNO|nr:hypothetical protein KFK09_001801 [Dendrobium nobile]
MNVEVSCMCALNHNSSALEPITTEHCTSDVCGNVSKENYVTLGAVGAEFRPQSTKQNSPKSRVFYNRNPGYFGWRKHSYMLLDKFL